MSDYDSDSGSQPEHFSDPNVIALQDALRDRDPFCSGICAIPDHQRVLYYGHHDPSRRIDVSTAGEDDLEALYRACKPAAFGRGGEHVLDASYRKAGKLDLTSFSTLLDPRSLGIHEQVSKALLAPNFAAVHMELYKLNVYAKGDFFKAHKDTPRGEDMFGSLVVVLPTPHTGGQLVLRHGEKQWTIDVADKLAAATEPSVCFVAFYGDIEHEVLPVTSGHRVTLTYNLYHTRTPPITSSIPTPFHVQLRRALVEVINDASKLPNGGHLGFGLAHEYVHTGRRVLEPLLGQLKGSDRALADACDDLGLRYSLKLLYRDIAGLGLSFVTTKELSVGEDWVDSMAGANQYLRQSLDELTIEEVEVVDLVGGEDALDPKALKDVVWDEDDDWLAPFYREPVTQVLEITPMASLVDTEASFMAYGNEPEMHWYYGTACMLVAVGPAQSRRIGS